MNEFFNINLEDTTKSTNKQQIKLYNSFLKYKYKNCKNANKIKLKICIGFYSLINSLLKKRNILNYDNSIIILNKLYTKIEQYNNKKSSLYTYFYHIINNSTIDILRKNNRNRIEYNEVDLSEVKNKEYKLIVCDEDYEGLAKDIQNLLPKDEYEVIMHKFWKVELTKKYSTRYYKLCLQTALVRIKNHYL
jgi:hypothetical protein